MLRDLVRIDTTNPPGNEIAAALYLRDRLAPSGVACEVVESAPGRGNLIARLRGAGQDKPLALLGHLDVVPADPADWTYPPFAAEIHDGYLWGRGSTDMKHMIALSAAILLSLAESAKPLRRDVLLLATADEERGGRMGVGWLAKNRPEAFDVDCVLNEGGGNPVQVGGKLFFTCQSAEKGLCRTAWTARAAGGHASRPRRDIATAKLARAVARSMMATWVGAPSPPCAKRSRSSPVHAHRRPRRKPRRCSTRARSRTPCASPGSTSKGLDHYRALFYDTVAVTGLRAGDPQAINVIAPTAVAYADGRVLPGQTQEGFFELLRQRLGDEVEVAPYNGGFSAGMESRTDHPIWQCDRARCGRTLLGRGGHPLAVRWLYRRQAPRTARRAGVWLYPVQAAA
jgi:acetylornithine deacetylase/succinyl-diaminopimelate desuccinylase-like protein